MAMRTLTVDRDARAAAVNAIDLGAVRAVQRARLAAVESGHTLAIAENGGSATSGNALDFNLIVSRIEVAEMPKWHAMSQGTVS